jgi:hypothetical protein
MSSAKERLLHLVSQATGGQVARAFLVGELADLLLDWPKDCPDGMRPPVLALFERLVREIGQESRAQLAERFGAHSELPLDLLNEFFLAAPAQMRREILMRNEAANDDAQVEALGDLAALMQAARDERARDFPGRAAEEFHIGSDTAGAIFADPTGEALAVLCKGAHLDRAMFSALAILRVAGGSDADKKLGAFDDVPQHAAERLTHHWQAHRPAEDLPKAAE